MKSEGEAYYEAEIFDDQGRPVLEPFTVPTRQPISLSAGSYDVHLTGLHRLGQSARLDLPRGGYGQYSVALNDQRLREPMACPEAPLVAVLQKKVNLFLPEVQVSFDEGRIEGKLRRRLDAATGRVLWNAEKPPEDNSPLWHLNEPWPPREVEDLDGDGVPDVLENSFAVSGRTGRKLWSAAVALPAQPVGWARGTSSADADLTGEGVPAVMTFDCTLRDLLVISPPLVVFNMPFIAMIALP